MKHFVGLIVCVLLAIGGLTTPSRAAVPTEISPSALGSAIPNRYIVVLKHGTHPRAVASIAGVTPTYVYDAVLNGFAATLNQGQLTALQRHSSVASIEQDQEVSINATQPVGSGQWGLDRIDQVRLPLNGTYTYTAAGAGINAYIISSGISASHPDFAGRAANVYDALGGTGTDCYGLGTHIAGVIGGATYGVAKQVNLRGIRYLDCRGVGTTSGFLASIDWLRANAARPAVAFVMYNGSWGQTIDSAMASLYNAGIFVAYPAGDAATWFCTSSTSYASVYMTTASNRTDNIASFANYGACVDIYAPGDSITSTGLAGGTLTIRSTAAAAAHVTGCAAKYKQTYGDVAPSALFSWLNANAVAGATPAINILYCPL